MDEAVVVLAVDGAAGADVLPGADVRLPAETPGAAGKFHRAVEIQVPRLVEKSVVPRHHAEHALLGLGVDLDPGDAEREVVPLADFQRDVGKGRRALADEEDRRVFRAVPADAEEVAVGRRRSSGIRPEEIVVVDEALARRGIELFAGADAREERHRVAVHVAARDVDHRGAHLVARVRDGLHVERRAVHVLLPVGKTHRRARPERPAARAAHPARRALRGVAAVVDLARRGHRAVRAARVELPPEHRFVQSGSGRRYGNQHERQDHRFHDRIPPVVQFEGCPRRCTVYHKFAGRESLSGTAGGISVAARTAGSDADAAARRRHAGHRRARTRVSFLFQHQFSEAGDVCVREAA